jgi:hypothetical protein
LNDIAWEKPNPPPNLSCRYFTHSTETILWAAKGEKSRHLFNYQAMRQLAGGKQMKTVWRIPPPCSAEKALGKHPTQKPVALVERCLLASTREGDRVLDPFVGSGTTIVVCLRLNRHCVGIEQETSFLTLAVMRLQAAKPAPPAFSLHLVGRFLAPPGFFLDLTGEVINRSQAMTADPPAALRPLYSEHKYVFVTVLPSGENRVLLTVEGQQLADIWEKASPAVQKETTFVLECELRIFRRDGG